MRGVLAASLARRVGEVLTLDVACQIMRETLNAQDRSMDHARFPAEACGPYLVQCERIDDALALADLTRHHAAYHDEVHPAGPPLAYDYARLVDRARAGAAFLVTVRAARVMVGSLVVFINARIDTGTLVAQDDRLWIDPGHRGGLLAARMFCFAERVGLALGVRECWIESRAENGAGRLAKFMGYQPVATKYVKTAAQDACGPSDVPTRHWKGASDESFIRTSA